MRARTAAQVDARAGRSRSRADGDGIELVLARAGRRPRDVARAAADRDHEGRQAAGDKGDRLGAVPGRVARCAAPPADAEGVRRALRRAAVRRRARAALVRHAGRRGAAVRDRQRAAVGARRRGVRGRAADVQGRRRRGPGGAAVFVGFGRAHADVLGDPRVPSRAGSRARARRLRRIGCGRAGRADAAAGADRGGRPAARRARGRCHRGGRCARTTARCRTTAAAHARDPRRGHASR